MRLAITSDLHLGFTLEPSVQKVAQEIVSHNPDFVLLLGDIGETYLSLSNFERCLEIFRSLLKCPIGVVIGNHDLWVMPETKPTSLDLWEKILPEKTLQQGCLYLEHDSYISEGVGIVGSYLHYDYSAREKTGPCGGFGEEYYSHNKNSIINDGVYFSGLPTDKVFSHLMGEKFKQRVLLLQSDPNIHTIVVGTHVPCLECLITRKPQDFHWARGTAYFGNLSHQDFLLSCDKVKYVFCGHSHVTQVGSIGGVKGRVIGSNYNTPVCHMEEV